MLRPEASRDGVEAAAPSYDERILLVAPTRRDADVSCRALASVGLVCTICGSLAHLVGRMQDGVGVLMLTDRILADPELEALQAALDRQPSWSSVPIVFLAQDRERAPSLQRGFERLRNVTLLDRPASMRSVLSAVQASLRGRRWQYEIRDQWVAQQRAEAQLREADQHKDEFLATLAHELRNPLAPIATGLQVLKRTAECLHRQPRVLDMMERQLAQLVRLIDQLLDVSRIATGKVALQRERVALQSVIEQAVEAGQPALSAAQHTLCVDMPPQAIQVFGDVSRLSQAVGNVLHNATKYTPNGGTIGISLRRVGPDAVVTVTDSGAGIPPDMLGRVFDLFAQVDRTLDRSQGGVGIGLSLVRSLVKLHGGTVTARSAGIDRGSCFEIRLPVAAVTAAELPSDAHPAGADAPGQRRLRVMVVDDNADAADAMAMLLQLNGHVVRVLYSASEALEAAPDFLPDAVFCDLGMPGMGGHEFATQMRKDRRFASTLLVAVTGWGAEEDRRRTQAAGFDHHLTKPAGVDSVEALLATR
jgi:two-component system, sensor histidine kinase